MYKFTAVVVSALLFAIVLARPAQEQQAEAVTTSTTPATIIKQVDVNNPDGSFNSSYETSNGIKVENIGYMKKILVPRQETEDGQVIEEHEEMILVQSGSYSYLDPEGNVITLRYVADENGFQPQGDHLPVPPQ
ncbi:endocuticle structural glycoprotein SgAbd-4-like [Musca domestica]|uniref:Endocuticle structural glycoprotein SgAbd-4 n=1 Tax=Musca domestica TaxID=7370 RepID=A0A1I8ME31_MUSDO|nr:endocuticle structural glycoprotein SgAbd-4 [Musca domestica]XP_058976595.1 endocuticle structural glycoprotein SgAbd-4-like [Musca domestica]